MFILSLRLSIGRASRRRQINTGSAVDWLGGPPPYVKTEYHYQLAYISPTFRILFAFSEEVYLNVFDSINRNCTTRWTNNCFNNKINLLEKVKITNIKKIISIHTAMENA